MKNRKAILVWCCIIVALTTGLGWKLIAIRQEARDMGGRGRLGQIDVALRSYYYEHGVYPPVVLRDANGKAMHSWRALILPYLDGADSAKGYDFKEPWDSPKNTAWAKAGTYLSKYFMSPGDPGEEHGWTGFVAVDGNAGVEAKQASGVFNQTKGSTKIAVVEVHQSGIYWLEPRDLTLDEALSGLVQRSPSKISLNFLTTDGKVGTLSHNAIVFRNSEEELLREWLVRDPQKRNLGVKADHAIDGIQKAGP